MSKIEELIKDQIKDDEYNLISDKNYVLINDTSAIVARKDKKDGNFNLIHYELKNKKLVKIYEWKQNSFCNNKYIISCNIKDDLFLQYGDDGVCLYAIYNYKKGNLIKPSEDWDNIFIHNNHKYCNGDSDINERFNYLDSYNGLLGRFEIEGGIDSISYLNPIVNKIQTKCIETKETFFAIINRDGSIRNNKLFLAENNSFSEIKEIIDLDKYESLDDFKKKKQELLERRHKFKLDECYHKLEETCKLDQEILIQILKPEKNDC